MAMKRARWITAAALIVTTGLATPSQAMMGTVRVTIAKAALVVGAGAGRGTLTLEHRKYPFTVQGLSLGVGGGVSVTRLVGRADYIDKLEDFAGYYSVVGGGASFAGGVGGVQLKNDKGVIITLQGAKAGFEFVANISSVVIMLDQSRSTPD